MHVTNEIEGREWCDLNGYSYRGTIIHPEYGYVMKYETEEHGTLSDAEADYYGKLLDAMQKVWIIGSEEADGKMLYKGTTKTNPYTYNITQAKRYSQKEAYQIATQMTKRSKTNRTWIVVKAKP